MRQTITVTQEDIANGDCGDPASCPIALALCRLWPEPADALAYEIEVAGPEVTISINTETYTGFLPDDACRFILAFDDGEPVTPLTFEIDWDQWVGVATP